jgi:hypothetical protein
MGANDVLALEANFKTWQEKRFPVPKKDINVFEYYCIDQYLRQFDLSDGQLKTGLIGGGGDGGVDAMYMFVNGELIEAESELDPKTPNNVKLVLIQAKEGEGFSPIAIDKLNWFVDDLLDLCRKKSEYHSTYRPALVGLMRLFKDKYGIIVGENPPLSVEMFYITKKDVKPNEDCQRSVSKVKVTVTKHFGQAEVDFHFVDAAALWAQVQTRPLKKRTLTWASQPMSTQEGEIGLVKLVKYYEFLQESNGEIAERIFDSNVRGYWKSTAVNKRIAITLKDPASSEFWLLNNGITILAEKIENAGFLQIEITDPQIVNGLQTSRQIYNYYRQGPTFPIPDERRVLIRIIKTADKTVRDDVVRCTNSQNEMPEEALRATDPIHRQIETLFHRYSLFYDRRKGHCREQGKPVEQIISVVDVLQAMLAVVHRRPDDARARPRNYFKSNDQYTSVFGKDKYDLNLYLKSIEIVRAVAAFLDSQKLEVIHRRNINFYLCMYATCAKVASAYAPPGQILKLDTSTLTTDFLSDCYRRVRKQYERLAEKYRVAGERDYDSLAKGPQLLKSLNAELKRRFKSTKNAS